MFISFTSFLYPPTIFRYDFLSGTLSLLYGVSIDFDAASYETTQVFYTSRDGTRVPMFLTHKKGLKLDGNNPVLLYGYGGFDVSLTPSFTVPTLVWLENGGVYAMANLRGGCKYGNELHRPRTLQNNHHTFTHFI